MKQILLALVLLATLGCDFQKKTPHVIEDKQSPRYIFVLNAKSGYTMDKEVTLKDINSVVYFSDRPARVAGHMELAKFASLWKNANDKENLMTRCAILSLMDPEQEVVIELSDPNVVGNTITFKCKTLPADLPKKFNTCALFIDMATLDSKSFALLERSDFHSLTCSCGEASQ